MSNKKESDTVYITSMFSLQNISSPHSKHSKKSLNSLHKHKISLNNKSRNKQIIMKTECNTITPNKIDPKLNNYFKDKFYEDIENSINHQLKRRKMFDDELIQKRVIHMKQIMGFWKSVCDYTNPILSVNKFKNSSAVMRTKNDYKITNSSKVNKTIPVLYTNSKMYDKIHFQRKHEEVMFYNKLKKKKQLKLFI